MSPPDGNVTDIREAFGRAEDPPNPDPAGPKDPKGKGKNALPDGCPVEALGLEDDVNYYLDSNRQLRTMPSKEHSRLGVLHLFGKHVELLYEFWPRYDKDGKLTGWRPEKAAEALVAACSQRGVWNALERVRGVGTWLGEEGELLMHAGDKVWQGPTRKHKAGRWVEPGAINKHVYPAYAEQPRQAQLRVVGGPNGPAGTLLTMLKTWRWRREEIDAQLMLGWICAAIIGGAIHWRPMAWLTGDRATGKSTLHELLRGLLPTIISVSDATGAGIWQRLGHASVPVAIDELEADEDNRRAGNIIKLARQAASGGVVLRGGADHHGTAFTARSCFLFSSILIPPMLGQDRSRMAILDLEPLQRPGDTELRKPPSLEPAKMASLGAELRRRLLDGWPRWATTLELYRQALAKAGHGGRGADQFGTLLAAADLALSDTVPTSDELELWADRLAPSMVSDQADDADHERCVAHLVTSPVDVFRGGARQVLNHWLQVAAGYLQGENVADADTVLQTYGLKLAELDGARWVAVANAHQGLAQLFAGTHWAGRSGTAGVWVQAMRRVPGAKAHTGLRFGGLFARCTLVPLDAMVLPPEGGRSRA